MTISFGAYYAFAGKVDILINNAGVGLSGCLESVTVDQGKKLFDVNVWGVVRVLQAVLPYMRAGNKCQLQK